MSLEYYLVDVLGIKNIFLDPAFINEQERSLQTSSDPQDRFVASLESLQTSQSQTLFIIVQNDLSATENVMLQKMAEALNWKVDHQQIFIPEVKDKSKVMQLIETTEHWLRKSPDNKLILFTEIFQTHPLLVPFFDVHHARVCEAPRNISLSAELKKITWDKIKIMKK